MKPILSLFLSLCAIDLISGSHQGFQDPFHQDASSALNQQGFQESPYGPGLWPGFGPDLHQTTEVPKTRPATTDLNFNLSCPPEETFRCIPFVLEDKNGKQICNIGKNYLNPKLHNDCGPTGKKRKTCITWKKDQCQSDYNTCLAAAFWDWLGIDDCTDTSTNNQQTTTTTAKSASNVVLLDIPMMDIPMMDDVDLVPTCTLQDNIIANLKKFTTPQDLEAYWRSLFQTYSSN